MHRVATQHKNHHDSIATVEWTAKDVSEWLVHFGKSHFNDGDRFKKYQPLILQKKVDGKALRQMDRKALSELGIAEQDIVDLYRGIQQLHSVIFTPPNVQGQLAHQLKEAQDENAEAAEDDGKEEEEEDNWEAPFLPYMYDAPQITLSEKTLVSVYSARVVSPYKKKAFALYELEVAEGKDEWLLSKRYSEFYKLYDAMKRLGIKTKINFPKKGIFYKSTDKQVMEDRKAQLTQYLNELLKDHAKARDSKVLSDFLSPSRTFVVDE